ncbi:30S ribosomal protein S1 [bacterium]|nr:30S ribosomal protein S1 [bacterium]
MDNQEVLNANEAANEESSQDMASALEEFEKNIKPIHKGDFLTGKVISVDERGAYVDVGYKTDGFIPAEQVSNAKDVSPVDVLKVGDTINVMVHKIGDGEGENGGLLLSKRQADNEAAWRNVMHCHETQETITATCTDQVKGGLIVDVGLRGFVPASHVDVRPVRDLSEYVGEQLSLKVLEVDKNRHKVVLSRKKAVEEERRQAKENTMNKLSEGSIVSGTVARLTNFGAFVNLGGVDGLVHISELSWKRIKQPADVVSVGQQVDVLVLKIDRANGKISLSLRQAAPDPFLAACDKYKVGEVVKGRITRLANKYAFMEVAPGVEGLIPVSEMDRDHVNKPADVLKVDQEVKAEIIEIMRDQRRITLSIKRVQQGEHTENSNAGRVRHNEGGSGNSIGDLLAAKLGKDKINANDIVSSDASDK